MHLITLVPLCFAITALAQTTVDERQRPESSDRFVEGSYLPELILTNIDGSTISTGSFRGKPMMINFWSVGCIPCIEEMPHLNALKTKWGQEVEFLAITADDQEKVHRFLMKHAFEFVIVWGAGRIFAEYNVSAIPFNLFVDSTGKILYTKAGVPLTRDPVSGRSKPDLLNTYGAILDELVRLAEKN